MKEKKFVKGIDLCGFLRMFDPPWDPEKKQIDFGIMGTREAFKSLEEMMLDQLKMVEEFGGATFQIFFRKPFEFQKDAFSEGELSDIDYGNRTLNLNFYDSLTLKFKNSDDESSIEFLETSVKVIIGKTEFLDALEICRFRQEDQRHGATFGSQIDCPPLGDWRGIE